MSSEELTLFTLGDLRTSESVGVAAPQRLACVWCHGRWRMEYRRLMARPTVWEEGQFMDDFFLLALLTILQIIMIAGLRAQTPEATRRNDCLGAFTFIKKI